jgi:hypothetical protein
MVKKILKPLSGLFLFLIIIYLTIPGPQELPPLPQSIKSTEPGDTIQIPGISAYYTDLSRQEVISFYQKNYSNSSFLNIPFLTYRLNHPPEMSKDLIRSTQQSSYLEEMVHPMRESLYVSGFEWENDPFTIVEKRPKNRTIINGHTYKAKITLIQRHSNPILRYFAVGGFFIIGGWLLKEFRKIILDFK